MPVRRLPAALLLLGAGWWLACQSPADRLRKLQLDFFRARPAQPFFPVIAENDTLRLPLPPAPNEAEQLRQLAESFRPRAAAFDRSRLQPGELRELDRFQRIIDSLARGAQLPADDPARYALDDLLRHFVGRDQAGRHPGLVTALVEGLPEYYQRLESSWAPADTGSALNAARRAELSLGLLERLEGDLAPYSIGYRERLQRALPAARYGMKDFIGLCESRKLN